MHRIAAVLKLLTQLNKLSSNNFIRHECQNGILGGCFFILFDGYHRLIEKGEFSASIISACSELEYWYYLNHETGSRIIPFNQIFVEYYDGERKQAVKDIELRNRIVHRHYRANKKEATDFLKSVERIHRNFSK